VIVKIEKNKISQFIIGDVHPDKGFICVPDNWGTKDILSFHKNGLKSKKNSYVINGKYPNKPFLLREICWREQK
jgi:hypothetical protein